MQANIFTHQFGKIKITVISLVKGELLYFSDSQRNKVNFSKPTFN